MGPMGMTRSSVPLAFALWVLFVPFLSTERLKIEAIGAPVGQGNVSKQMSHAAETPTETDSPSAVPAEKHHASHAATPNASPAEEKLPDKKEQPAKEAQVPAWTTNILTCEKKVVGILRKAVHGSKASDKGMLLMDCSEVQKDGKKKWDCSPVPSPQVEELAFPVEGLMLYLVPIVEDETDQKLATALSTQHAQQVKQWGHFHISLSSRGKGPYRSLEDAAQLQLLVEGLRQKIKRASQKLPSKRTLVENGHSKGKFFGIEMAPTEIFAAFADFPEAQDVRFNRQAPWNFVFANGLKEFGNKEDKEHYKFDLAAANIAMSDAEKYWDLLTKHSRWQWMVMANNGPKVRLLHAEEIALQSGAAHSEEAEPASSPRSLAVVGGA